MKLVDKDDRHDDWLTNGAEEREPLESESYESWHERRLVEELFDEAQ